MPRPRAILFDLGDTLIGLGPQDADAMLRGVSGLLLERGGLESGLAAHLAGALLRSIEDEIREGFLRGLTDEHHLPEMLVRHAAAHGHRLAEDLAVAIDLLFGHSDVARFRLPEAAGERVREFRDSGYRLGIVSNTLTPPALLEGFLAEAGILHHVDVRVYSCDERVRKPHPAIYRAALERLGVAAPDAVFVGDRLREDVAGPQHTGMRAVLTHEFRQEQPSPGGPAPDGIIGALPELHALLAGWGEE